ncbi:MAG: hypothetical protein ACAH59_02885 [Pseudobdellovibrionaceae bacterium]
MKGTYSALMQSRFFTPAFNSAIFDGPLRIYFAQFHESLALKIYFTLQQRFPHELARAKEMHKFLERTVLVMVYPTSESFHHSFESEDFLQSEHLSEDTIIGINGPFEDNKLDEVLAQVLLAFQAWEKIPLEKHSADAIL